MSEILLSPLIFVRAIFSILFVEKALICIVCFIAVMTGYWSYKHYFKEQNSKELLILLAKAKLSIIALGIPVSFVFLVIFESLMYFTVPQNMLQKLPSFLAVFFTYGWALDGANYYLFLLDLTVYFTISCSAFEYYILKEKFENTYPKKQIIKAVLYSNIPVCLMAMGYYIHMFYSPSLVIK